MVNIASGIVHCRLKYWRSPLPLGKNIEENARLWKTAYNTVLGSGTEKKYIEMVTQLP